MKKFWIIGMLQCLLPLFGQDMDWNLPSQSISTNNVSVSVNSTDRPRVGIDLSGNAVATWIENGFVMANYYSNTPTPAWGSPIAVSKTNQSSAPQLVVDSAGNATLLWVENGSIKTASQSGGGSWTVLSNPISTSSGASSPYMSVDFDSGNVAAVWLLNNDVVQVARKPQNGSWTATSITSTGTGAQSPAISISGIFSSNQLVMAVWYAEDNVTSTNIVYGSTQLNNGSWTPQTLSDGTYQAAYPKVALDLSGNAVVAWFRYDVNGSVFSNVIVEAISQMFGGNWTDPIKLSSSGIVNPANLSLKVRNDENQNAVVGWTTSSDGNTYNSGIAVKPAGRNWSTNYGLTGMDLYAYSFDLAANQVGEVFAVYMGQNTSSSAISSIYSRETDIYSYFPGWTFHFDLLSQGTNNGYPRAASSSNGTTSYAAAVWLQSISGVDTVQAVTGTGQVYPTPTIQNVSQLPVTDFGVFQVYTNQITWTASSNLNTTRYFVFRNGTLIGVVPANSTLQFLDTNQPQTGTGVTITYGVAAVDNMNAQSQVDTYDFH